MHVCCCCVAVYELTSSLLYHITIIFCICHISLVCTEKEIRLYRENDEKSGIIEVCYEGVWGSVCDDDWGNKDANVACKQLGFFGYGELCLVDPY